MIIYTVCVVLVYAIKGLVTTGPRNDKVYPVNYVKMWDMVGFSFYSFEGIGTVMPIRACSDSPEKFPNILTAAVFSLGAFYLTFGLICYLYFGSMDRTFVIYNLSHDDKFLKVTELLYCINLVFTYPLAIYPTNQILERFLFNKCLPNESRSKMWLQNLC